MLDAGARLGAYVIEGPLGGGAMGEVYLARDTRLDRSVAIKILKPELSCDRDAVARFEREARAASALNHPHILHIYDVAAIEDAPEPLHYIVMEYVEGRTMREIIESGSRLDVLLKPLIDMADALSKAHAAGIVHRDLKPENIMVSRDGYAKVLDFGLAKLSADRVSSTAAEAETETVPGSGTRAGVLLGTVGYMSPEQALGRTVDARSDIFSFGCILYEAASGVRAFRGSSVIDTLHKIATERASPSPHTSTEACGWRTWTVGAEVGSRKGTEITILSGLRTVDRSSMSPLFGAGICSGPAEVFVK